MGTSLFSLVRVRRFTVRVRRFTVMARSLFFLGEVLLGLETRLGIRKGRP
jgi:hypothetical protein